MSILPIIRLAALVPLMLASGCFASPSSMTASLCYVVDGDRERYLEVDKLARSIAADAGLDFVGRSPGALEVNGRSGDGKIVISSPSGSDASLITLFSATQDDQDLSSYVDLLLSRIEGEGMVTKTCADVPGLTIPAIYGHR